MYLAKLPLVKLRVKIGLHATADLPSRPHQTLSLKSEYVTNTAWDFVERKIATFVPQRRVRPRRQ